MIVSSKPKAVSSNAMSKKLGSFALSVMLIALGFPADAQQVGKIFRIGFLDSSTVSGSAVLVDAFRQELSKLGWVEGRISPSSTGLPYKRLSDCPSLRRSWFVLRLI
jgi:hypothetical protein